MRPRFGEASGPARAGAFSLLLVAEVACGAAPIGPRAPATEAAPATDADPRAFAPPPGDHAHTGAPVGLAVHGRDDEARRLTLRFLEALRDRSTTTLEALLADPVSRAGGVIARAALIAGLQRAAEADGLARSRDLDELFDVPGATVTPLSARRDPRRGAPRYRPDDLLVSIPVRGGPGNRRLNDLLFVRLGVAELVVRLGPDARIVGL